MGCRRGSILGPLLFILYINDLPNCLHNSKPYIFADDTNLFASSKDIVDLAALCQKDLDSISTWCKLNLLTLNTSKTAYLLLSAANQLFNFEDIPAIKNPPNFEVSISTHKKTNIIKQKNKTIRITTITEVKKVTPSITETSFKTITTTQSTDGTTFHTSPPMITTENRNPLNLMIDGEHIWKNPQNF